MMFKGNPSGRMAAGDVSQIKVCIVEDVASSREDRKKEIRKEEGTTAGKC